MHGSHERAKRERVRKHIKPRQTLYLCTPNTARRTPLTSLARPTTQTISTTTKDSHARPNTSHKHKTSQQQHIQNLSIAPLGDPSSDDIRCRFGLGGEPFPLVGETRGDAGMAALVSSSFRTSYRCARGVVGRQRQFTHETSFSIVAVGSIANEKTMKVIAMSANAYGKRRPVGD